jgi:hypothetical protein
MSLLVESALVMLAISVLLGVLAVRVMRIGTR